MPNNNKSTKKTVKKISNSKSSSNVVKKTNNNTTKKDKSPKNNTNITNTKEKKSNDKVTTVKNKNSNTGKKVTTKSGNSNKKTAVKQNTNNKKVNEKNTKNVPVKKNANDNKQQAAYPKKLKTTLIIIAAICLTIILIEAVYVIIYRNKNIGIPYYDSINSLAIDDTNIISVGSSDFKYSKTYDYTSGNEKGKLVKYDKDGKVLFEKMYDRGINNTFSSVISVDDGYVVVGSGVFSEKEQEENAREAFIIKYDFEGNIIWEKFYQVVTNTKFNKVIATEDGYIAVGQSIYANMEMGNHTTGGGIIVKYDKDGNVVWYNNHGGMKSGSFNDIVEVDGSFYVVGKDATDSGNIVKFSKDGKYEWHKNYSYTDSIGFTGIAYLNNSLYVVGSKKILTDTSNNDRNTTNTDALMVVYDLDGTKKFEKTFGGTSYDRYNSILAYRGNLYVVGHTSSKDAGFKIDTDGSLMTGIVVRYDEDGNILKKDILGGSNNDNLTDIITDGACLYISGYSNSGNGNITTNKNNDKDYFGKIVKLDFKFRTIMVK